MDLIPPEIKEYIFKYLDSSTLEDAVSAVCKEWASLTDVILEERVVKMQEYFQFHPQVHEEMRCRIVPEDDKDQQRQILRFFEKSFLGTHFNIDTKHLGNVPMEFLLGVHRSRGCDCHRQNLCIIRSLHFMQCHHLIVTQMPEKCQFYSMDALLEDGGESSERYETSVLGSSSLTNIWIDNNTHTALSVYHDLIVSQETTRALIIFKVAQVDHSGKKIVLENIRRIYLPLWSCDLIMLKDMVCILFTTGSVGIWRKKEDDIIMSRNTAINAMTMRNMQLSKMYRFNQLVLVKIVTNESVHWSIFDASNDSEEISLYDLQMNALIGSCLLQPSDICSKVVDLFLTTNSIIAHCQVVPSRKETNTKRIKLPSPNIRKIICRRFLNTPSLESFLSVDGFLSIFGKEPGVSLVTDSSEIMMAPFSSALNETQSDIIFKFIGLNDFPIYRSKPTSSIASIPRNLNIFHCVLYSAKNCLPEDLINVDN